MSDDVVNNLKSPSQWLRVLFMILFAFVLYLAGIVLLGISLLQIIFSLATGTDNRNLRGLGAGLGTYIHDIIRFLTYNSEVKPFPFMPFPPTDPEGWSAPVDPAPGGSAGPAPGPLDPAPRPVSPAHAAQAAVTPSGVAPDSPAAGTTLKDLPEVERQREEAAAPLADPAPVPVGVAPDSPAAGTTPADLPEVEQRRNPDSPGQ